MRHSEWVSLLYFVYLLVVAAVKAPWRRRTRAMVASAAAAAASAAPMLLPRTVMADVARDWLPAVFLTIGYWLSGWYFVAPMPAIEARLLAWDRRVLGLDKGAALVAALPRVAVEALELAYVGCFLFVPAGMFLLAVTGHAAAADRFWTLVLLSEFGSFGLLPWVQTRPPRVIEAAIAIDQRPLWLRHVNRFMVKNTSIGVNTFPSGHVAGALAVAIGVSDAIPSLAPWLFATAFAIAAASVLGRYHYLVDAVAGAALTLSAWILLAILWR